MLAWLNRFGRGGRNELRTHARHHGALRRLSGDRRRRAGRGSSIRL